MDTNTILLISTCFASFFTFQVIFHVVSYWFSAKISPGFNNLNFKKKIEWNSRGDPSLGKVNVAIASGYLVSGM
ncbi:hypothetical protein Celaphus_00002298 [Cervus elaphus hippelaphus]|uniref:Uncharacterized protein n=1 Tax=Cervus elaphus hippelaphus TaxID=46360 RepID=A0A212CEY9_CEREH|nr:hypothetical protein Celaphus_00002298 [Cervus elaphus hippelaphus]